MLTSAHMEQESILVSVPNRG